MQGDMRVAVFGLGYVGTVTAACLAVNGHDVWGVDPDELKVAAISHGTSPIVEPGLQSLVAQAVSSGKLHATVRPADALDDADISLLCVGTPSATSGETNLAHIYRVVEDLVESLTDSVSSRPFHTVVIRSTVPPGTVEDVNAVLQGAFQHIGPDVGVAMCPEFLREGTGIADFFEPPYTVIGASDLRAIDAVSRLFAFLGSSLRVVHPRTAEALKYACNAFHATKISFANDMGRIFSRLGVDSREVMELFCEDTLLNISPKYLRPGFAFGGSCLPKDLRALLYLARAESVDIPLLSGVLASNRLSIDEAIDRVVAGAGHRVAMLGLSFKPDSDDLRESPYVDLAETLLGKGYEVRIYDPVLNPSSLVGANRQYVESRLPHLKRILTDSPEEAISGADIAIVSHSTTRVVETLIASPPLRVLDLDGRLGPELEALDCYEGFAW
jgi:GDP-mannose 6-dehydrogenase